MKISGHKTESIYPRYAIVAERDIADGLRKVAAFQKRVARSACQGQVRDSRVPPWVPKGSQVVDGLVAWDGVEPPTRGFSVSKGPLRSVSRLVGIGRNPISASRLGEGGSRPLPTRPVPSNWHSTDTAFAALPWIKGFEAGRGSRIRCAFAARRDFVAELVGG